jgi:hypothetical protein
VISCLPGLRLAFLEACEDGRLPAVEALAADQGFKVVPGRHGQAPKLYRARHARADDG